MADKRPDYVKPKKEVEGAVEVNSTLGEQALKLRELKDQKEKLEDDLTSCNKEIASLSLTIDKQLESMKVDKVRVAGAGTLYVKIVNHPNVNDLEGFIGWLDENNAGAMAKRTIHPSTLASWVGERLKNNEGLPRVTVNGKEHELVTNFQERRITLLRK